MVSIQPLVIGCALTVLLASWWPASAIFGQTVSLPGPARTSLSVSPTIEEPRPERLPPISSEVNAAPEDNKDRSFWRIPTRQECYQWVKRSSDSPSWTARPFSTSYSLGAMDGDHLVRGRLDQGTGFTIAKRYGWDFAEHWGTEARLAEASLPIIDLSGQMPTHTGHILMADVNLLLYPWGDTRVRPFVTVGTGLANFNFDDIDGRQNKLLLGLPVGFGCKYYWNENIAIRIDAADNLVLGGQGLSTTSNASLTIGAEMRIGNLKELWPWHKRETK